MSSLPGRTAHLAEGEEVGPAHRLGERAQRHLAPGAPRSEQRRCCRQLRVAGSLPLRSTHTLTRAHFLQPTQPAPSKPPALSQRSGSSPPSAASLSTRKDYARGQTPPRVSPCLRTACSSDAPTPTVALAAYQLAAYPSIPAAARAIPAAASGVQCRPGQPATMVFLVPSCRAGRQLALDWLAQTRKGTGSNPISDFRGGTPMKPDRWVVKGGR